MEEEKSKVKMMPGLKGKKKTEKKEGAKCVDAEQITEDRDIWSMRKGSEEVRFIKFYSGLI